MLDDVAYLDMVLWRTLMMLLPNLINDVTHPLKDIGYLMISIVPCNDLAHFLILSITHWTMDVAPWS
jgi:hypothetical protein